MIIKCVSFCGSTIMTNSSYRLGHNNNIDCPMTGEDLIDNLGLIKAVIQRIALIGKNPKSFSSKNHKLITLLTMFPLPS